MLQGQGRNLLQLPLGSKSLVQRCRRCYAESSELLLFACAVLFELQRCTILMWPWGMKFGDVYHSSKVWMYWVLPQLPVHASHHGTYANRLRNICLLMQRPKELLIWSGIGNEFTATWCFCRALKMRQSNREIRNAKCSDRYLQHWGSGCTTVTTRG
jgi:hypothetical protein